jgi:carbon monoxide dehydrogenase subunit G
MDLELVGGCFPGATVTGVTDEGFTGTVKVKLGPIALTYAGSGTFLERDEAAHRAVIEAKGKDKRGNGTAGATVTIQLADEGGSTTADVSTDLNVTGKPAQFGRGVMQDVSDKLLGQFVACIESRLAPPAAAATEPSPGTDVADEAVARVGGPVEAQDALVDAETPMPRTAPAPAPAARTPAAGTPDAVDLGATVLPVLVRSYGKPLALGVVVGAVVWLLTRRLRRRSPRSAARG